MGKGSSRLVLGTTSAVLLLVIFLLYAAYFTSDVTPFDSWRFHLSNWNGNLGRRKVNKGEDRVQLETTGFSCHADLHSEVCVTNKPVILDNNALTAYLQSSQVQVKHMVQPYARKEDETAMKKVTPVQILTRNASSPSYCHFNHDVPVVVFSSGGFTGNLFHDFNEIIIPLFLTSKDGSVHCFPGAVIGLKYHDNLALYPTEIPGGYSMFDFKHFLRETYNLKIKNVSEIIKPKLILISRPKTRTFMNEDEIVDMMEELGFQVDVATPNRMSNLEKFAEELNSCSVMVGAHGAGLTNAVFLPAGAVMVQVVPLGLDWASTNYFGGPASEMGVHYVEYKIEPEESSLFKEYGPDHPVIVDPKSIFLKGYDAARATYVDGQNMKINLVKFREILLKAMTFLGH
uniref:Glycosyltransferase 61 catalytic domain-containing protein n=1 Tax=Fagus sylvatica TaxID=28930 RepID=A0A2N9H1Z4_FAGSY